MERPAHDPIDDEAGWGEWVLKKTNAALDEIVEFVVAREVDQQACIADLTRQNEHRQADLDALVRKHADLARQLAEREAMLNDIQAVLAHAGESVGERLVALEAEVSRYQGDLLEALRERDDARERIARALLAETGHPQ